MPGKRKMSPINKFFTLMVIGVIVYVFFFQPRPEQVAEQAAEKPAADSSPAAPTASPANPAPLTTESVGKQLNELKNTKQTFSSIIKSAANLIPLDKKSGEGIKAVCGHKVKVNIDEYDLEDKKISSTKDSAPVEFIIGENKVIKGLELGVVGMRKGGVRSLAVSAQNAYGDPKFADSSKPADQNIKLEIELLDISPSYDVATTATAMPLKIYEDVAGYGNSLACNETADINFKIWDINGNIIASTLYAAPENPIEKSTPESSAFKEQISTPIQITVNGQKIPYAFLSAITGDGTKSAMLPGSKRTLLAPSSTLVNIEGKIPVGLELPQSFTPGIYIVEIELLPKRN